MSHAHQGTIITQGLIQDFLKGGGGAGLAGLLRNLQSQDRRKKFSHSYTLTH